MRARFVAAASSLLIGILFIVPGTQLNGQDEHHEASDAHHETVDAHQGENGHGEATKKSLMPLSIFSNTLAILTGGISLLKRTGTMLLFPCL